MVIYSELFPLKMVILHIVMLVYQRVTKDGYFPPINSSPTSPIPVDSRLIQEHLGCDVFGGAAQGVGTSAWSCRCRGADWAMGWHSALGHFPQVSGIICMSYIYIHIIIIFSMHVYIYIYIHIDFRDFLIWNHDLTIWVCPSSWFLWWQTLCSESLPWL